MAFSSCGMRLPFFSPASDVTAQSMTVTTSDLFLLNATDLTQKGYLHFTVHAENDSLLQQLNFR